jgi:hypothetical protein
MRLRKLLAAIVLAWLGLTGAMAEASFVHSDDGCAIETHCNACLLRLRTAGVVTVTFSLPPVVLVVDEAAPVAAPWHEEAAPGTLPSRGPPLA